MNNFKNKLYSVYPRIYCSGSIYVNDVPVVDWYGEETKNGGYGGDVLINNAVLQSGKYKVTGKMYPRKGKSYLDEEDTMMLQFFCADPENWKNSRFEFHPKIESPWDGLSENINYPFFEISTEIEVELPFELDGWQKSVDFLKMDKKKLFKDVLNYYKQIHVILLENNASKFLEISKEKMTLHENAFYFSEERKKDFLNSVLELFNQKLEVEPLVENELQLEIIGNGKLVRLIKNDRTQPLQFKSKDTDIQSNIELEIKLHMRTIEKGFSII